MDYYKLAYEKGIRIKELFELYNKCLFFKISYIFIMFYVILLNDRGVYVC